MGRAFGAIFGLLGLFAVASGAGPAGAETACGGPVRCAVEGGYYLASPPPGWDRASALPVVVYFHGWNGSPEGTFRNRAMVRAVHARGAMFVAPYARTGYWRQIGPGRAEGGRDELAFVQRVMADLARRWPVDRGRVLASGFSRGASMVWNLACYAGDLFTAFAPIAGGFWNATPERCPAGPVRLRHIHGRADRVVAFDVVGIYNSMPIPEGLDLFRRLGGCAAERVAISRHGRGLVCESFAPCAAGEVVLCLHDGGHSIPAEWVAEGYDWMVGAGETAGR